VKEMVSTTLGFGGEKVKLATGAALALHDEVTVIGTDVEAEPKQFVAVSFTVWLPACDGWKV
jgi:hypothetical protein